MANKRPYKGKAVFCIDKGVPGNPVLHMKIHAKFNPSEPFAIKNGDKFVVQFDDRIPLSSAIEVDTGMLADEEAEDDEEPVARNASYSKATAHFLRPPTLYENRPPRKRRITKKQAIESLKRLKEEEEEEDLAKEEN